MTKTKTAKTIDYSEHFYDKDLLVEFPTKDKSNRITHQLMIEINDFDFNPDCKIGNFYHNFWFRTHAGIKFKKYSSKARLEQAVWQCAIKHGFKPIKWIDKT